MVKEMKAAARTASGYIDENYPPGSSDRQGGGGRACKNFSLTTGSRTDLRILAQQQLLIYSTAAIHNVRIVMKGIKMFAH